MASSDGPTEATEASIDLGELCPLLRHENTEVQRGVLQVITQVSQENSTHAYYVAHQDDLLELMQLALLNERKGSGPEKDTLLQVLGYDALRSLINMSRNECISASVAAHTAAIVDLILNGPMAFRDLYCMLLSNVSKQDIAIQIMLSTLGQTGDSKKQWIASLVPLFCQGTAADRNNVHRKSTPTYHFLGNVFANITTKRDGRITFLKDQHALLNQVIPSCTSPNLNRRGGVLSVIKNCCFETRFHESLITDDLIFKMLEKVLHGSGNLSDEDAEKIPSGLLSKRDAIETDEAIILLVLDILILLSVTRHGRQRLRHAGGYLIIREFHKANQGTDVYDEKVDQLVQVLAREDDTNTEEDFGVYDDAVAGR